MRKSVKSVVTIPRDKGLQQQKCFPLGSGDQDQSDDNVGFFEDRFPWLGHGHLIPGCVCDLTSAPYGDLVGLGPTHTTPFRLRYLFKGHITKRSHLEVLGLGRQHMNGGRGTVRPITPSKDNPAFSLLEHRSHQTYLRHRSVLNSDYS